MAHSKNFFSQLMKGCDIVRHEKGFNIEIYFHPLGKRLDKAQLELDKQVWADMQQYMPRRDGELIRRTNLLNQVSAGTGEVHIYDPTLEYAHYQYMGEKYVDPVYRVGGFYGIIEGKEGQWWSRRGVRKVPSGEPLHYTKAGAISLWDAEAIEQHGNEWVELVRKILRGK